MKVVIEYNIITDFEHKFVISVNKAIKNGWQPIGGLSIKKGNVDKPDIEVYSQAMVKYEENQRTAPPLKNASEV